VKGSIQRGRTDGVWYLRAELPRTPDGHRRRQRERFLGTKKEAERRLRDFLREVERGHVLDAHSTFAQIAEGWLAAKRDVVEPRTFERYDTIAKKYIVPTLGSMLADKIRPSDVQRAVTAWRTKLSARGVAHVLGELRAIFAWAQKMEIVFSNPATVVDAPRGEHREMKTLDQDGVAKLLRAAAGNEMQPAIALMLLTGLRRGEALGLKWSDFEANEGRLAVRRSLESHAGGLRIKAPKTARSARTIMLAPEAVDVLRTVRRDRLEQRIALGVGRIDADEWIFATIDGAPLDPKAFSKRFARLVAKTDLGIRLHDLRHSYGTLAIAAGISLQTVSRSMGHSGVGITDKIYAHRVEQLERDAAERIDLIVGSAVREGLRAAVNESGPQRAHNKETTSAKPRGLRVSLVAGPGFEPGTFGL